jgi:hypothetical protein
MRFCWTMCGIMSSAHSVHLSSKQIHQVISLLRAATLTCHLHLPRSSQVPFSSGVAASEFPKDTPAISARGCQCGASAASCEPRCQRDVRKKMGGFEAQTLQRRCISTAGLGGFVRFEGLWPSALTPPSSIGSRNVEIIQQGRSCSLMLNILKTAC